MLLISSAWARAAPKSAQSDAAHSNTTVGKRRFTRIWGFGPVRWLPLFLRWRSHKNIITPRRISWPIAVKGGGDAGHKTAPLTVDVSQERGRRCANFPELRAEMHANALRRQNFPLAANDLSFSTAGFLLVARLLATSGGFRKRRAVRPGRVNSLVTSKRY